MEWNSRSGDQEEVRAMEAKAEVEVGSGGGDADDDGEEEVSLDANFFLNENYQIQKFAFGEETIELYCLQSSLTDYDLTGQLVWPGAELLADYLQQKRSTLKDLSVLELGAGLGLTGLLCARFCHDVVITDYHETILKVMQMNVDHQNLSMGLQPPNVVVQKLEWGFDDNIDAIFEKHPKGFDLIMGADICYQQSCLPPLFNTMKRLLKQPAVNVSAILAYVSRWESMDAAVNAEASRLNMEVKEVPGTRKKVAGGLHEGWIYEISLKAT